ncbi:uncharacterized protein LOC129615282 [Condylostylus longicornis]|uniref:uncharacterized protein LOC129615282 n=1 Tax=Condylostylus longicornis TaxID=2530218 RepID=UPI00244E0D41|nr:uncharacterized protein LOC129615282 [Condylostylus longicornis]
MYLQRFRSTVKILFWCLFLLQIILFGIYWFYQQEDSVTTENYVVISSKNRNRNKQDDFVYFITKNLKNDEGFNVEKNISIIDLESHANFEDDFYIFTESGRNLNKNVTCFRQGTIIDSDEDNNTALYKNIQECRCKVEWHGKDCSQPEIIWRALMTSRVRTLKSKIKINEKLRNKIIYMITGHFISLDILEIQLLELSKSVDYFILCQKPFKTKNILTTHNFYNKVSIEKKLKLKVSPELYKRILVCDEQSPSNNISSKGKCTPKLAYEGFKSKLSNLDNLKLNDIFVFSEDDEILNYRAIKYFQYGNDRPFGGVTRFRLKYNVYGFFWQHPLGTKISSALCSINDLEKNFKGDPERLLNTKKPSLLIGDLNHIGGWYCRYCYQPNEIVDKLTIESVTKSDAKISLVPQNLKTNEILFPKQIKNGQIDSNYIQNLIASGLYIDGKVGLTKQHRYSDKYYSPDYVENNSWKFNNLLVNMFVSINDDYEYRK